MSTRPTDIDTAASPADLVPQAPVGTGYVATGDPVSRTDGHAKVTGQARYAAEHPVEALTYAVVVNTVAATGRIVGLDVQAALAVPGVIDVLSHLNRPKLRKLDLFYKDMIAPAGSPFKPFASEAVVYSGQPVALVVAHSFEAARYAASLVRVTVEETPHDTDLVASLSRARKPDPKRLGFKSPPRPRGEADVAFETAPVKVAAEYHGGAEHHNPMEMHATTVIREANGHLTVYDKNQGSQNCRMTVSHVFGLSRHKLTVKNPFVGGAFGSGLRPKYNLLLAVMASLHLKRSVRLVLTRQQMFTFGHRPETWQHVKLAAERDGTLKAIVHEAIGATSRYEDYVEIVVNWAGQLYRCDNVRLQYQLVELDQASPCDMRAPGAAHGLHALEIAMDELATELAMDPLQLRLVNYAERDPQSDKPHSSKTLRACYEQGAERFGWAQRDPRPRQRKEGHEWVGWGMASGVWDAMQMAARVSAVLHADGRLVLESAASDIGTGTYTVMAQIAAASLGLPLEQVQFRLGDSRMPFAAVEGGSAHVATVGSAVDGVCEKLKTRLLSLAKKLPHAGFASARLADVEFVRGTLRRRDDVQRAVPLSEVLALTDGAGIEAKYLLLPALLRQRKYLRATHAAVFCEVRVDEELGTVRVTRVVSAVDAGRIMNAKLARSQVTGSVVWGISQALHEETHTDHRLGRFMNHSFAEYHVAVNADIHDIDVIFVQQDDPVVSRLGAKGIGEIGIVGVAAAVSNAIYHAVGRRVRSLPMTPDKVMAPGDGWAAGDVGVGIPVRPSMG